MHIELKCRRGSSLEVLQKKPQRLASCFEWASPFWSLVNLFTYASTQFLFILPKVNNSCPCAAANLFKCKLPGYDVCCFPWRPPATSQEVSGLQKKPPTSKTPRNYHHYSSTAFLSLNQPGAQTFIFCCVVFSLCFVVRFGRLCLSNTHTSCCSRAHEALYQSSQSSADSPANSLNA